MFFFFNIYLMLIYVIFFCKFFITKSNHINIKNIPKIIIKENFKRFEIPVLIKAN